MNDEGRRNAPHAIRQPDRRRGYHDVPTLPIVAALEALEVDDQELAVAILQGALEDAEIVHRSACTYCGSRFEWPGQLVAHFDRGCPALLARELPDAA